MHATDHAAARPAWRRRLLLAALLLAGAALALPGPLAASASASPYVHGLSEASAHLRVAIEIRPTRLGEYLGSSEVVCGLAEDAASRGDEAAAEADWNALAQLVAERDRRETGAIDAGFARADASLVELRRRFSRAWRGQPQRVRELQRGVAETRRGVGRLRRAMRRVAAALPLWEERDCAGARAGVIDAGRRIPAGLDPVNRGMTRLWGLAIQPSTRPGRSART